MGQKNTCFLIFDVFFGNLKCLKISYFKDVKKFYLALSNIFIQFFYLIFPDYFQHFVDFSFRIIFRIFQKIVTFSHDLLNFEDSKNFFDDFLTLTLVQYPGVADSFHSDLDNLTLVLKYSPITLPDTLFLPKLVDFARRELTRECDYKRELEANIKMKNLLKGEVVCASTWG